MHQISLQLVTVWLLEIEVRTLRTTGYPPSQPLLGLLPGGERQEFLCFTQLAGGKLGLLSARYLPSKEPLSCNRRSIRGVSVILTYGLQKPRSRSTDIPQPPNLSGHSAGASLPSYCLSLPIPSQLAPRHPFPSSRTEDPPPTQSVWGLDRVVRATAREFLCFTKPASSKLGLLSARTLASKGL